MSRMPANTSELPLATQLPDRPPTAEELYLLDLVDQHTATPAKPFMTIHDIDAAMAPHPGATPRSYCERVGWLERAQSTKQVPKTARRVSDKGREITGQTQFATEDLDKRIRESEARAKQFNTRDEHTDLPRLRTLRTWLAGPAQPTRENPLTRPRPPQRQNRPRPATPPQPVTAGQDEQNDPTQQPPRNATTRARGGRPSARTIQTPAPATTR